ncbi:MAG: hypothetical protein AB1650_04155 [Candidatus Omnitrophota bacterium]
MNYKKHFSILNYILYLAVSCLFLFIIIDKISIAFLRRNHFIAEKSFSITDLRKQHPYIMFKGAPGAKSYPKIFKKTGITETFLNKTGYPGEAPVMPKPADEFRVIVLGGSTVFIGNPEIPRLIQYQYEKKGCQTVKVYNFGVISSVSSMELARLVFEALDYNPDMVIFYNGFNDMDHPFAADPRPGYPYNYFIYESNPILDNDVKKYPGIPLAMYSSNILRYFFPDYFLKSFYNLDDLRTRAGYLSQNWKEKIAEIYVTNLIKSQKISRAFGAEFIAFFQPSLYVKKIVTEKEQSFIDPAKMAGVNMIRSEILKRAETARREEGLNFIDLSGVFNEIPDTVYEDRVHILQQYQPLIAATIFEHLNNFLKNTINLNVSSCFN